MNRKQVCLKPRAQPFGAALPSVRQVYFLHPDYADGENILLALPALDDGGIHHETARVACCIMANCEWDGYLSATKDGLAVDTGPDDILTGSEYFFRIDSQRSSQCSSSQPTSISTSTSSPPLPLDTIDSKKLLYPVVPSFDHFRFPTQLPPSWTTPVILPATSDKIPDRDRTCRLTCSSMPNEICHVIPAAQESWWQSNCMFRYTAQPAKSMNTDCGENAILLRRDLHKLWDIHKFAIVPKQDKWVVHVLNCSLTTELQDQYHNLELQPLYGVRPEFLFARFALAILADMSLFVKQPLLRSLVMLENKEPKLRTLSGRDCYALFGQPSKNRSQSPKKRSRSAATLDQQDGDDELDSADDLHSRWLTEQWGETLDTEGSEEESDEDRGRPVKRRRFRKGSSSASSSPRPESMPSLTGVSCSTANSSAAVEPRDHRPIARVVTGWNQTKPVSRQGDGEPTNTHSRNVLRFFSTPPRKNTGS